MKSAGSPSGEVAPLERYRPSRVASKSAMAVSFLSSSFGRRLTGSCDRRPSIRKAGARRKRRRKREGAKGAKSEGTDRLGQEFRPILLRFAYSLFRVFAFSSGLFECASFFLLPFLVNAGDHLVNRRAMGLDIQYWRLGGRLFEQVGDL